MTDLEYEIQVRALDNKRRDDRLLLRLRLYWVQCFICDGNGQRILDHCREIEVCHTVQAENRKQAKRLFEEVETPGHEFISLSGG